MTEEDLRLIHLETKALINTVFDFVGPLEQQRLLGHLYDFQAAIEGKLGEKE